MSEPTAQDEGASILIVDDDSTFRERLAQALRRRGFEARTAADYDDAIRVAHADPPEPAVIDLRMPGRSAPSTRPGRHRRMLQRMLQKYPTRQ